MGSNVRNAAVLDDATAVEHETVRRAKLNLTRIVEGLIAHGYRFTKECDGRILERRRKTHEDWHWTLLGISLVAHVHMSGTTEFFDRKGDPPVIYAVVA